MAPVPVVVVVAAAAAAAAAVATFAAVAAAGPAVAASEVAAALPSLVSHPLLAAASPSLVSHPLAGPTSIGVAAAGQRAADADGPGGSPLSAATPSVPFAPLFAPPVPFFFPGTPYRQTCFVQTDPLACTVADRLLHSALPARVIVRSVRARACCRCLAGPYRVPCRFLYRGPCRLFSHLS